MITVSAFLSKVVVGAAGFAGEEAARILISLEYPTLKSNAFLDLMR